MNDKYKEISVYITYSHYKGGDGHEISKQPCVFLTLEKYHAFILAHEKRMALVEQNHINNSLPFKAVWFSEPIKIASWIKLKRFQEGFETIPLKVDDLLIRLVDSRTIKP